MIDLTAEQQQLAKIVHDYACQFPLTEDGDAQLSGAPYIPVLQGGEDVKRRP